MTWGSRSLICGMGKKLFSCRKFTFSGKQQFATVGSLNILKGLLGSWISKGCTVPITHLVLPTSRHPLAYWVKIDLGPSNSLSLSDGKESVSKLAWFAHKVPGGDSRFHCSHGLCGFANTKFLQSITVCNIQGPTAPPRASSQPVLPAKFLQQDSFMSSLLSVYRIRQGKFQGAGIEQVSRRTKELFPFIKPQPCPSSKMST